MRVVAPEVTQVWKLPNTFFAPYFIHEKKISSHFLPVLPAMTKTRTRGWYEHCSSISHMLLFLFLWIIDVFCSNLKNQNRHQKSSATLLKSRWGESNSTDGKEFQVYQTSSIDSSAAAAGRSYAFWNFDKVHPLHSAWKIDFFDLSIIPLSNAGRQSRKEFLCKHTSYKPLWQGVGISSRALDRHSLDLFSSSFPSQASGDRLSLLLRERERERETGTALTMWSLCVGFQ